MIIRRTGRNQVMYEMSESDMNRIGCDMETIKQEMINEGMTEGIKELIEILMSSIEMYLNKNRMKLGAPIQIGVQFGENKMGVVFDCPMPYEIFLLDEDYEEEVEPEEVFSNSMEMGFADEDALMSFVEGFGGLDDFDGDINGTEDARGEERETTILFQAETLDRMGEYVAAVSYIKEKPHASLYKHKGSYFLISDFSEMSEETVARYKAVASEWLVKAEEGKLKKAYIEEHGTRIIEKDSFEVLLSMYEIH